jgi:hypothetical protein
MEMMELCKRKQRLEATERKVLLQVRESSTGRHRQCSAASVAAQRGKEDRSGSTEACTYERELAPAMEKHIWANVTRIQ